MPVAYVTENGAASGSNATSATFSLTPSGSDRYLLLAVQHYGSSSDPSGITFNGSEAFTKLSSTLYYDASGRLSFWYLKNPTATTANVVVTFGATVGEHAVACACFSGVDQTTPLGTGSTDYDNTQTVATVTPDSAVTDLAVILFGWNASYTTPTDGGSQDRRSTHFTDGYSGAGISTKAGASPTTTLTITTSATFPPVQGIGYAIKPATAGGQNVSLSGIASTIAFGAVAANQEFGVAGIASTSAFGTVSVKWDQIATLSGIASAVAFGTVAAHQSLSVSGIAPTADYGVITAHQTAAVSGIAPTTTFGDLQAAQAFSVSGIEPTIAFGVPTATVSVYVPVVGIGPTTEFGALTTAQEFAVAGIGPTAAFGTPVGIVDQTTTLTGIAPTSEFGTPTVTVSVYVAVNGIASTVTFGTPTVSQAFSVAGIAPTVAFGTPTPLADQTVTVSGLAPATALGTITVSAEVTVAVSGIESAIDFGTLAVLEALPVAGIGPTIAFGTVFAFGDRVGFETRLDTGGGLAESAMRSAAADSHLSTLTAGSEIATVRAQ